LTIKKAKIRTKNHLSQVIFCIYFSLLFLSTTLFFWLYYNIFFSENTKKFTTKKHWSFSLMSIEGVEVVIHTKEHHLNKADDVLCSHQAWGFF